MSNERAQPVAGRPGTMMKAVTLGVVVCGFAVAGHLRGVAAAQRPSTVAQGAPTIVEGRGRGQQFAQPEPARNVTVLPIAGVVAAGARWELAWSGTDNADGIAGMPEGSLLFAQEQSGRVSRLDGNNRVTPFITNTAGAGAVAIDANGRVYAVERTCTDPGLNLASPCAEPTRVAIIHPADQRTVLADNYQGKSLGRVNDLVVARNGSVYFTSGDAYHLARGGGVSIVGVNLRTNGVMLSPDEKVLYVTNGQGIAAFDVQADGAVVNQREFARLQAGGSGDGLAIDAAGRLYVTTQPGVQVFAPDGTYLGLIPTPRAAISVAFAGPEKKTLFIVGSGATDREGREITTLPGVRNNAKSIFKLRMVAQGFLGRAK